ncbi:MAG: Na+/H+ antiporter subunit E [Rickettsiales bacterium]|nr:Na+/H+ antiporter subunit E [Rickettsiales bacterium]
MLNIFNLFLFLFALWIFLIFLTGNISWLYLSCGILSSACSAILSYKLKLIEKKSELLYLSFGFYRHFTKIYLANFVSSLKLIKSLAFSLEPLKPKIEALNLSEYKNFNLSILIATINMKTGLLFVGHDGNKIFIHSIDFEYFAEFDLKKYTKDLTYVNDDNLV